MKKHQRKPKTAVELLSLQIERLKTHLFMLERTRGNPMYLPTEPQLQIIERDLRKVRAAIRRPLCFRCEEFPQRGGNRQGSALCQNCFEGE